MRHGACKAQRGRRTTQEAPGSGVGNLAAKLKRQISHTKFRAHQIYPPPLYNTRGVDPVPLRPTPVGNFGGTTSLR